MLYVWAWWQIQSHRGVSQQWANTVPSRYCIGVGHESFLALVNVGGVSMMYISQHVGQLMGSHSLPSMEWLFYNFSGNLWLIYEFTVRYMSSLESFSSLNHIIFFGQFWIHFVIIVVASGALWLHVSSYILFSLLD